MKKKHILLIVCCSLSVVVILIFSNYMCISYQGFAVDDENHLYIGEDFCIAVYDFHNNRIKELELPTSRGYKFTINANNNIIIYTGSYFYTINKYGEIIDYSAVTEDNRNDALQMKYCSFRSADGTEYKMTHRLFRAFIYKIDGAQKTLIYKMPMAEYYSRIQTILVFLTGFIAVGAIFIYNAQKNYEHKS